MTPRTGDISSDSYNFRASDLEENEDELISDRKEEEIGSNDEALFSNNVRPSRPLYDLYSENTALFEGFKGKGKQGDMVTDEDIYEWWLSGDASQVSLSPIVVLILVFIILLFNRKCLVK